MGHEACSAVQYNMLMSLRDWDFSEHPFLSFGCHWILTASVKKHGDAHIIMSQDDMEGTTASGQAAGQSCRQQCVLSSVSSPSWCPGKNGNRSGVFVSSPKTLVHNSAMAAVDVSLPMNPIFGRDFPERLGPCNFHRLPRSAEPLVIPLQ